MTVPSGAVTNRTVLLEQDRAAGTGFLRGEQIAWNCEVTVRLRQVAISRRAAGDGGEKKERGDPSRVHGTLGCRRRSCGVRRLGAARSPRDLSRAVCSMEVKRPRVNAAPGCRTLHTRFRIIILRRLPARPRVSARARSQERAPRQQQLRRAPASHPELEPTARIQARCSTGRSRAARASRRFHPDGVDDQDLIGVLDDRQQRQPQRAAVEDHDAVRNGVVPRQYVDCRGTQTVVHAEDVTDAQYRQPVATWHATPSAA